MSTDIFDNVKIIDKASNPSNACGGMHGCRNRDFDNAKPDCNECLEDYNNAMMDFKEYE